jgi:predicted small lipoprotein YifL
MNRMPGSLRKSVASALFAAVLMVIAGCGQKGPLTLPAPAQPASAPAR